MKILKVQPFVDPGSYKLKCALESFSTIDISTAIYSSRFYSESYRNYATACSRIGPQLLMDNRMTRYVNWAIEQSNLMLWPFGRMLGKRIDHLAKEVGASLIHTNGTPDALGCLSKEFSELPVVHEIYDTYSLSDHQKSSTKNANPFKFLFAEYNHRKLLGWEECVHNKCDALIFVSEDSKKWSEKLYGRFRSIVIPNGVLKKYLPLNRRRKLSHLDGRIHCVYLGLISSSISHRNIVDEIMEVAKSKRVVLHLYPIMESAREVDSLMKILNRYENIRIHKPLHYEQLYEEITQYDLGLVLLGPGDKGLLDVALPNKLFEYVAMGLPVAIPPFEAMKNFIKKYDCGFTVHDWSEDIVINEDKIGNVAFHDEFTIDYYIPELIDLYKSLV